MKRVKLTILWVTLAIFAMMSCTKQAKLSPTTTASGGTPVKASNDRIEIANSNNPYDSIGYYHNELLNYFNKQGLSYKTSISQKVDWSSQYFKPIYGENVAQKMDSLKYNDFFMQYEGSMDSVTYSSVYDTIENWEQKGNIGSLIKPYYIEVLNSLDDFDTSKVDGYKPVINEITQIEDTVAGDDQIGSTQKKAFFYFSSVARYSSYFWFTHKDLLNNLDKDKLSQFAARASLDAMAGGATLIDTAWEDVIPVYGWIASLGEAAIAAGIASCS